MSERKVLNKYYPPDFDPSKIPRMKLPKNRQYTVRLMAPFNMRCKTCGEYIYKGKKFNARKEDVENEDYLGIRIYRFYIKCTRCLQEISFKTDPRNTDYEIEAGATRNFMALKLAEEQALREEEELREEEANNPMKLLENRTEQSKNEIELLESLEELKDLNKRQQAVDYDTMLSAFDTRATQREIEEKMQQMDEEYIKTVKFQSKRKFVVEEEIVETESENKQQKLDEQQKRLEVVDMPTASTELTSPSQISAETKTTPVVSSSKKVSSSQSWNKSIGSLSKKGPLIGLVKVKKSQNSDLVEKKLDPIPTSCQNTTESSLVNEKEKPASNGLSLLGSYSDSD